MAPQQAYLKKVGMEGFALLEEAERHKARPQPYQFGVRHAPRQEPMDFYEAAKLYGGMIILDGRNKKLFPKPY